MPSPLRYSPYLSKYTIISELCYEYHTYPQRGFGILLRSFHLEINAVSVFLELEGHISRPPAPFQWIHEKAVKGGAKQALLLQQPERKSGRSQEQSLKDTSRITPKISV